MMEKILAFLSNFDYWQIVFLFLLFVLYSAIAKPSFKWKDFQLNFFSRRNGYSSFIVWKSQIEKKIYFLEYLGTTKAQMKRVDLSLLNIKDMLMNNYAVMLRAVKPNQEVTSTRDYMDYGAHVEVMLKIVLRDKIREIILDQDIFIPDITTRDFEEFCRDTAKSWYEAGKSYMDLWYVSEGRAVNREDLKVAVYTMMPSFERETRDILREIKNIELEMTGRIEEYKKEIRAREKKVLGTTLT